MAAPAADAVTLKAEGNALYVAKDYEAAYAKYDAAINLDATNAILHANRGACSFAMNKFADAAADCKKALEIDPKYTKAWARLANSLQNMGQAHAAIAAYEDGLKSLPARPQMTPTDWNLKGQCEEGIRDIRMAMHKAEGPMVVVADDNAKEQLPWKRARRIVARLLRDPNATDRMSSAWVISEAYREFKDGLDIISRVKKIPDGEGAYTILGQNAGLTFLTNGIIRDPRVFHIENPHEFQTNYNLQIEMEARRDRAWPPLSDAKFIIQQALQRQKDSGWDAVRPALSTTIRFWIMKAVIEHSVVHDPFTSLDLFTRAVDVLEWGRRVWKDVPTEQRGKIFTDTFLVGVKNLRIEAMLSAYSHDPSHTPLDSLHDAALDLIEAVGQLENPADTPSPGFVLSFFAYPKAHAHAMLGLYYRDLAESQDKEDTETIKACYHQSGVAYKKAGLLYPKDDENYCYYLACAVDMLYLCTGTVQAFLDIMEKIRMALPKVKEIWENSHLLQKLSEKFRDVLQKEKRIQKSIAKGKLTMDSIIDGDLKPVA